MIAVTVYYTILLNTIQIIFSTSFRVDKTLWSVCKVKGNLKGSGKGNVKGNI
jgi:hypothetical protein